MRKTIRGSNAILRKDQRARQSTITIESKSTCSSVPGSTGLQGSSSGCMCEADAVAGFEPFIGRDGVRRLERLIQRGLRRAIWPGFADFPGLVDHGYRHAVNVCRILLSWLLDSGVHLSRAEAFYLVGSAWLHDIGCKVTEISIGEINSVRETHGVMTAELLTSDPSAYMLSITEARAIGYISSHHQKAAPLMPEHVAAGPRIRPLLLQDRGRHQQIEGETVRFPLLIAMLRICDACDRQKSRFRRDWIPLLEDLIEHQMHSPLLRQVAAGEANLGAASEDSQMLSPLLQHLYSQFDRRYMEAVHRVFIRDDQVVIEGDLNRREDLQVAWQKIREEVSLVNPVLRIYGQCIQSSQPLVRSRAD